MQETIKEQLSALAERIRQIKKQIKNEEATKTAFIMPFLQIMGYDVFNPAEVAPEYTADVGVKANEKVDYAIIIDGEPVILIECKKCSQELNACNESQLLRYYNVTQAKFGILTNGIEYKFYADIKSTNQMDLEPFFSIDLSGDIDAIDYDELAKFHRLNFHADKIRKTAEVKKNANAINKMMLTEFLSPSREFVSLFFKKLYPKSVFNANQCEIFTPLVKSAIEQIINDTIKEKLDAAYRGTEEVRKSASALHETLSSKIETTQDELDGYSIIRSFAAELNALDRVHIRDAQTYCAILFDDNNRKPIARFYFNNPTRLMIMLFDPEEKIYIQGVAEIFAMKKRIQGTISRYIHKAN